MGMLSPSAKVVILRARPSGPKSSRILTRVARLLPGGAGKGYSSGVRDPEPAAIVEGEVERLVDVRLGGDELDLEARRQTEEFAFLVRRAVRRGGDVGIGLGLRTWLAATRSRRINTATQRVTERIISSGRGATMAD